MKVSTGLMLLAAGAVAALSAPAAAQPRLFFIGTGNPTGVYFAAGEAICQAYNKQRKATDPACRNESVSGATANIIALRGGELQFGVTQANVQYHAAKGTGPYASLAPFTDLRSVFSIYTEAFVVVLRPGLQIENMGGLRGKRFNIGQPGTGTRYSFDELSAYIEVKVGEFLLASELRADAHGQALCGGRIDGFFFGVGHPAANIQEPTSGCGAKLLPLTGPSIDRLLSERPYYIRTVIPGGTYPSNPQATPTYGVRATLVTTRQVSTKLVYDLTRAVFENLPDIRSHHPGLKSADQTEMVQTGNLAPLHDGALRYFKEKGWM